VSTFDEIPAVSGNSHHVSEEYSHLSVHFITTDDGAVRGGLSNGDPGSWSLEGTNGPQFLGFNGRSMGLTVTFDQLMSAISLDVARSNGSSAGGSFTMEAYLGDQFVDSQTVVFGDTNEWVTVNLDVTNVDRLTWQGQHTEWNPYGADNFSFAPVPEPGTLSVLVLGGLAVLRKRRK